MSLKSNRDGIERMLQDEKSWCCAIDLFPTIAAAADEIRLWLFNLKNDPHEKYDLAGERPKVVVRLKRLKIGIEAHRYANPHDKLKMHLPERDKR